MVAHLLTLKLQLLRNSFRRSPWQLVGVIIGGLYGLGIIAMLIVGLVFLADMEPSDIAMYLVLAVSLITLGWAVIPLVAFGVDLTLDPARFTTFTISRRSSPPGCCFPGSSASRACSPCCSWARSSWPGALTRRRWRPRWSAASWRHSCAWPWPG
ncbi:hypothetical protein [Paeniglutamicibacter kerguelensis]|uniref:hypothetical protein n=1 Tax=Paeniglutamicibacter kerguelensis TaxID=254788 RepID=UPI00361F4676